MERHYRYATRGAAAIASVSAAILSGCSDFARPEASPTRQTLAQQRMSLTTNSELPRFQEPLESSPELRITDPDAFHEQSDAELVAAVRQAGGRVSIGLKPVSAQRTSVSRVVPAMTRTEVLAARAVLEERGARIVLGFRNFSAVTAEIDPTIAPSLRQLPVVNYVEAEFPGYPQSQDTSWGVMKIRANLAWDHFQRGQQSFITILDQGLDLTHISSGDGPAGFYGDCYYTVTNTCYWTATAHGVLVAGVIAGRDNEEGYIGIANQPTYGNFASIKIVADDSLTIAPSHVAWGLDWAISSGYPRHTVNMSFGFCESHSVIATAVAAAANAGILMVAAVGNNVASCPFPVGMGVMYPARYPEVIGVSGTTEDDTFWSGNRTPCGSVGSRGGPYVELSAPYWSHSMSGNGQYSSDCGTSYSAAAVTGVAALAWTKYPSLTAAQLRAHLTSDSSVVDLGPPGYDGEFGWGRIDAAKAVGWYPPPPPPPQLTVLIVGASEIQPLTGCNWTATVTNGTPPFSYAWFVNGQAVGANSADLWYENTGSPFVIAVTVTDAGGQATDDHPVFINSGAPCPF